MAELVASAGAGFAGRVREAVFEAFPPASPPPLLGVWGRTGSTNDLARMAALDGEGRCGDGGVFVAEEQTAGRGRYGRSWESPRGGLYLSLLAEPFPEAPGESFPTAARLGLLPIAAGVALAAAIRRTSGAPVVLRWPNDLDLHGCKVAGILVEAGFAPDRPGLAVVGFGVNLRPIPGDLALDLSGAAAPPGALGPAVSRAELAGAVVASFRRTARRLAADPLWVTTRWEALSPASRGQRCRVELPHGTEVSGVTDGLDPGGGLAVALDGGGRTVVHAVDALRADHRAAPERAGVGVRTGAAALQ